MISFVRTGLVLLALSLGLLLSGCEGFDPTSFMDYDFFNTKKRLPKPARPSTINRARPSSFETVNRFCTQRPPSMPNELMKGYQPAEQAQEPQPTAQAVPSEPKPKLEPAAKAKPKPRVVAKPKEDASPPAASAQPTQAQSQVQWPDPPPMQQQSPAGAWPGSSPSASGAVAWPDPPPTR